jgi:hypothetical protein
MKGLQVRCVAEYRAGGEDSIVIAGFKHGKRIGPSGRRKAVSKKW